MENLLKTDFILFEDIHEGITNEVLIELGKVLMPYQIDWFIHIHKVYDIILKDSEVQQEKKKLNLNFNQESIDIARLITDTIKKQGNRYIDWLLTLALYSRVFDESSIVEENLIHFSNENDCYYFENDEDLLRSEKLSDFKKRAELSHLI